MGLFIVGERQDLSARSIGFLIEDFKGSQTKMKVLQWKPRTKFLLIGALSLLAIGFFASKLWPNELVTKPDRAIKASVSGDAKKLYALSSKHERDVLGLTAEKFLKLYDMCFRESLAGVQLRGERSFDVSGNPPTSGYALLESRLPNGSITYLGVNSYLTEDGPQINLLRSLIRNASMCDAYRIKPNPTDADEIQAQIDLVVRITPKAEELGIMGVYDQEKRKLIPWSDLEQIYKDRQKYAVADNS